VQGAGSSAGTAGGSPASKYGNGGPAKRPAEAAAAVNATWQARSRQLREQDDRARQARFNRARQQGRSWAQGDQQQPSSDTKQRSYWEWPDGVKPYLQEEHPEVLEQLLVPSGMNKISQDYLWKHWLRGAFDKGAVDRWLQSRQQPAPPLSRDGASSSAAAEEGEWVAAKTSGNFKQAKQPPLPEALAAAVGRLAKGIRPDWESTELLELLPQHLWALPLSFRWQLAGYWRAQVQQQWAEELQELQQDRASKLQQELKSLQSSSYESLLKKARMIGCTTTGAALQKQLLTSRSVAPE
jgi:hypothetical protein